MSKVSRAQLIFFPAEFGKRGPEANVNVSLGFHNAELNDFYDAGDKIAKVLEPLFKNQVTFEVIPFE